MGFKTPRVQIPPLPVSLLLRTSPPPIPPGLALTGFPRWQATDTASRRRGLLGLRLVLEKARFRSRAASEVFDDVADALLN
jgi:hypothetical protein